MTTETKIDNTSIKSIEKQVRSILSKEDIKRYGIKFFSHRHGKEREIVVSHPVWLNITIDKRTFVQTNDITFSIHNDKVCVTLWHDKSVSPHITVY